jgi:hypothetical protein
VGKPPRTMVETKRIPNKTLEVDGLIQYTSCPNRIV